MKMEIEGAARKRVSDQEVVAQVQFRIEGHPCPYEITLFSKDGKEWEYGLHFAKESGREEHIDAVEEWLEEDDAAFDILVEAAMAAEESQ